MKYSNAFFTGFFSVFGLCSFPFAQQAQAITKTSVRQALNRDWQKVQGDLATSFKRLKSFSDGQKSEA